MADRYSSKQVADRIQNIILSDTVISRGKCFAEFIGLEDLGGENIEELAYELLQRIKDHVDQQYPEAKEVVYGDLPPYIKEFDTENKSLRIIEDSEIGHPFYYTITDVGENKWLFQTCVEAKITLP